MIDFYNSELERFNEAHPGLDKKQRESMLNGFINTDPTQISWTRALRNDFASNKSFEFQNNCFIQSLYRPFAKQWLYYNRNFNEILGQMPRIFPRTGEGNLVIMVKQRPQKGKIGRASCRERV